MTETRVLTLSEVPLSIGFPESYANPIKPELFAGKNEGRFGKLVGMTQLGVNCVELEPGAISSLRHWHTGEDEFVYVLTGRLTLIDDNGEHEVEAGAFAGFPAGIPHAHHLANTSKESASFLSWALGDPGKTRFTTRTTTSGPSRSRAFHIEPRSN